MPKTNTDTASVVKKLEEINITLQDLLIVECARAGIKKADIRIIARCDMNRITRIWKHVKMDNKA